MRTDRSGAVFPDYELSDHRGMLRELRMRSPSPPLAPPSSRGDGPHRAGVEDRDVFVVRHASELDDAGNFDDARTVNAHELPGIEALFELIHGNAMKNGFRANM